jgi:hypothetical protein
MHQFVFCVTIRNRNGGISRPNPLRQEYIMAKVMFGAVIVLILSPLAMTVASLSVSALEMVARVFR